MLASNYDSSVFINCPFDEAYQRLFEAIVFCVHDCGFSVRSALEVDDSAQVRIDKIYQIIAGCKFGIHDLSRTEPNPETGLPRFNMPLELGIFLGARKFGQAAQREKRVLVLDREAFRYLTFISDIRGQDIKAHNGDERTVITLVRNWLRNALTGTGVSIPSGSIIFERYEAFQAKLPMHCAGLNLDPAELIFNDYIQVVEEWLKDNPW